MQIFERHFQLNYSLGVRDGFTLFCLMICIWHANRVPDPVLCDQPCHSSIKNVWCLSSLMLAQQHTTNGPKNSQHCWLNNVGATTINNTQQTDATCNIEQCWEFFANDVASVWTGLKDAWPGYSMIANSLNTLKPLLSGHSPSSVPSVRGHFVVPVGILGATAPRATETRTSKRQ